MGEHTLAAPHVLASQLEGGFWVLSAEGRGLIVRARAPARRHRGGAS